MRSEGVYAYATDWINVIDQLCICCQLAANVLFWFREDEVSPLYLP